MKNRFNYLNVDQQFILNHACRLLWDAGLSVYQVGSSLERKDYRDVDLRAILYGRGDPEEKAWQAIHDDPVVKKLVEMSISSLLQRITNLPIDFQIQSMEEANNKEIHKGKRNAVGMFVTRQE